MQTLREWLKVFGVILAAIMLGETSPIKSWAQMIDEQRGWLLPVTIGLAVVGFLMLLWGWVRVGQLLGQPMSHDEVERLAARTQILGPGKRFSKARLWGETTGVKVDPPMEWSFQEMKAAWRRGIWWANPDMRRKYIITVGGTLCILGFFAVLVVAVDPASVKLILCCAMLYAAVRLTMGFWQA